MRWFGLRVLLFWTPFCSLGCLSLFYYLLICLGFMIGFVVLDLNLMFSWCFFVVVFICCLILCLLIWFAFFVGWFILVVFDLAWHGLLVWCLLDVGLIWCVIIDLIVLRFGCLCFTGVDGFVVGFRVLWLLFSLVVVVYLFAGCLFVGYCLV